MACAYPSRRRTAPIAVQAMAKKVPCDYALILVWQNGKVENCEFVADTLDGGEILWKEYFSFRGEWARWKSRVLPTIPAGKNFELWAKWKKDLFMIHPEMPTL
jgi:hypothetical protein